jgi:hypothetical protein
VNSLSLEDMTKKKRDERMKNLGRKAYHATGLAGGTSATASPSVLSHVVQRDLPAASWGGSSAPGRSSARVDSPAPAPASSLSRNWRDAPTPYHVSNRSSRGDAHRKGQGETFARGALTMARNF